MRRPRWKLELFNWLNLSSSKKAGSCSRAAEGRAEAGQCRGRADLSGRTDMSRMTINTPPQVEEARAVLAKLETLSVGQSIQFDPPLTELVVHALYLLLRDV